MEERIAAVALDTPALADGGTSACSEALILRFGEEERDPGMVLVVVRGLSEPTHKQT